MKDKFLDIMKSNVGYVAEHNDYTREIQMKAKRLTYKYNKTEPDDEENRRNILKKLFEDENLNVCIEPPFHCD